MATDFRDKKDYYKDPLVQRQMAENVAKWGESFDSEKEPKPALTGKEKRLERAWKSPYRMAIKGELEWRLEHPGREDTPAKTRLKKEPGWNIYWYLRALFFGIIPFVMWELSVDLKGVPFRTPIIIAIVILCLILACVFDSKKNDTTDHDRDSEIYRYALDIYRDGTSEKFFAKFLHL